MFIFIHINVNKVEYIIKSRSFWTLKAQSYSSWSWKKLLKLREIFRSMLKFRVGNGKRVFLWNDNWHFVGPLMEAYPQRLVIETGLPSASKLSAVIKEGDWNWPASRSSDMTEIQIALCRQIFPSSLDNEVLWIPSKDGKFQVSATWRCIKQHYNKVPWYHLIWLNGIIPKHSFISWLAIYDRLSTRARQHKYTSHITPFCSFYGQVEIRYHLFFAYAFTSQIQRAIQARFPKLQGSGITWDQFVLWGSTALKRKTKRNTESKLAWHASLYHVWLERNSRFHNNSFKSVDVITSLIFSVVECKIFSLQSPQMDKVCLFWVLQLLPYWSSFKLLLL